MGFPEQYTRVCARTCGRPRCVLGMKCCRNGMPVWKRGMRYGFGSMEGNVWTTKD